MTLFRRIQIRSALEQGRVCNLNGANSMSRGSSSSYTQRRPEAITLALVKVMRLCTIANRWDFPDEAECCPFHLRTSRLRECLARLSGMECHRKFKVCQGARGCQRRGMYGKHTSLCAARHDGFGNPSKTHTGTRGGAGGARDMGVVGMRSCRSSDTVRGMCVWMPGAFGGS